nr:hypothetical protein [uncultured Undibacterium sp.]
MEIDKIKATYEGEENYDCEVEQYNTGSTNPAKKAQNQRAWEIYSDPFYVLEILSDEWLNEADLWGSKKKCDWKEIYGVMALLSIDESIEYISCFEPYKAASWALRATELINFGGLGGFEIESNFSPKGIAARHAQNREMKKKGIELYLEKKWVSKADAARRISPQVNRTEGVVLRWIREHHKK